MLRDLAIRVLNERGTDIGTARRFTDYDRGIAITRFEARYGAKGLTVNHRSSGRKLVSVFVIHWGGKTEYALNAGRG